MYVLLLILYELGKSFIDITSIVRYKKIIR